MPTVLPLPIPCALNTCCPASFRGGAGTVGELAGWTPRSPSHWLHCSSLFSWFKLCRKHGPHSEHSTGLRHGGGSRLPRCPLFPGAPEWKKHKSPGCSRWRGSLPVTSLGLDSAIDSCSSHSFGRCCSPFASKPVFWGSDLRGHQEDYRRASFHFPFSLKAAFRNKKLSSAWPRVPSRRKTWDAISCLRVNMLPDVSKSKSLAPSSHDFEPVSVLCTNLILDLKFSMASFVVGA